MTQTLDGGEALNVTPSVTSLDTTGKIVTLSVPAVVATAVEQNVVYSVIYKNGAAHEATVIIPAELPTYAVEAVDSQLLGNKIVTVTLDTANDTEYTVTVEGTVLTYSLVKDAFVGVLETSKSATQMTVVVAKTVVEAMPIYTITAQDSPLLGNKIVTVTLDTTIDTEYTVAVEGTVLTYSVAKDAFVGVLETTKAADQLITVVTKS